MKIKDIVKENRPRERFVNFGPASLSDAELLSIILRTGNKEENVIDLSNRIIKEYGLENLFSCSVEELMKIKGIGRDKAVQILSIAEIQKRNYSVEKKKRITCAKDVYEILKDKLQDEKKEYFYVVLLDTKNKVIKEKMVSMGILDASIIHPREIFSLAIKSFASRIILVHNHPSGDPTPSEEDIDITKKLIDVGNLVGIEVLDHVIIGKGKYYSYIEG